MGINKKISSKKRKPVKARPPEVPDLEELKEALDDLFIYFDLTDDSYSEPPQIVLYDGMQYARGLVDTELHDILMRIYGIINKSE